LSTSQSPRPPWATSAPPWDSAGGGLTDPSAAGNGHAAPRRGPAGARRQAGPPAGRRSRGQEFGLVLALYLATISVDALRKLAALPTAAAGIIYILTGLAYLALLRRPATRAAPAPRWLPVWLALLSVWCAAEAIAGHIPVGMAVLGWVSYVFFVPLFYIGADLMADDRRAAKALRVAAIAGGVVGLGAVASALLGQYAPAILQPLTPGVGIHSFSSGNIYLAPSVFATAEEASEQLLVALFAWAALTQFPVGRLGRAWSAVLGVLIGVGLFATARRADLVVAVAGMAGLIALGLAAYPRQGGRARVRARGRLGPALILAAAGSLVLLSLLGTSKLVPFLTSGSNGENAVRLMFSPASPGSLTGQGPGTSTQGAGLVGATSVTATGSQGPYTEYVLNGRSFRTAEGGLTKTWLELGIVGVLLYAGVFWSVLGPLVRRLGRADFAGRALTVLTLALGIVFLKGHQSLDNPLVQPLFWLAAGGAWGRMRARAAQPPAPVQAAHRSGTASRSPALHARRS
jgi:hypothetical protein